MKFIWKYLQMVVILSRPHYVNGLTNKVHPENHARGVHVYFLVLANLPTFQCHSIVMALDNPPQMLVNISQEDTKRW